MKKIRILLIISIIFILFSSITSYAKEVSIEDAGIKKIDVPDNYMVCLKDKCDDDFQSLLSSNKFTFESWQKQVMGPSNYSLYACDDKNNCMYVIFEKNDDEEITTNDDGTKKHKLMNDYNMIEDADKKNEEIKSTNNSLISQGVSQKDITKIGWASFADSVPVTPFIEYSCFLGGNYIYSYETVYNADRISVMFSSPNPFSKEAVQSFAQTVEAMEFTDTVDYSQAKKINEENIQLKLAKETHSEDNTKIIRILLPISIGIVIIVVLILAIRAYKRKNN